MKILLTLLLVAALAAPSAADPIYTANGHMTTATIVLGCGFSGIGDATLLNGESQQNQMVSQLFCPQSVGFAGTCTHAGAQFWIRWVPSGTIFDDENATISCYGGTNTTEPDSVMVHGTESGMEYYAHFTNPHLDQYGRTVYDYFLFRPCCGVSGGGNTIEDPPIRR